MTHQLELLWLWGLFEGFCLVGTVHFIAEASNSEASIPLPEEHG